MKEPLLIVEGLRKSLGGRQVLRDVSFTVERGGVIGLVGGNGAGKTTIFNILSGHLKPDVGTCVFDGHSLKNGRPSGELGIVRSFQDIPLFPDLTVLDNVLVGLDVETGESAYHLLLRWRNVCRGENCRRQAGMEILARIGMDGFASRSARELSIGQRRILSLARFSTTKAKLILLDEPAAGMDVGAREMFSPLLARLRETGKTVLIIEHDMDLIMRHCDRVYVLADGRVSERVQNFCGESDRTEGSKR